MTLKPRLFGTKKPRSPDLGRIQRTLQQSETPHSALTDHPSKSRAKRAMVYREVAIAHDSGYRRKGIVLDYSSGGARLRFPTNEILPDTIYLYAGAVGLEGPARVIWQHGSEVGLAMQA